MRKFCLTSTLQRNHQEVLFLWKIGGTLIIPSCSVDNKISTVDEPEKVETISLKTFSRGSHCNGLVSYPWAGHLLTGPACHLYLEKVEMHTCFTKQWFFGWLNLLSHSYCRTRNLKGCVGEYVRLHNLNNLILICQWLDPKVPSKTWK